MWTIRISKDFRGGIGCQSNKEIFKDILQNRLIEFNKDKAKGGWTCEDGGEGTTQMSFQTKGQADDSRVEEALRKAYPDIEVDCSQLKD